MLNHRNSPWAAMNLSHNKHGYIVLKALTSMFTSPWCKSCSSRGWSSEAPGRAWPAVAVPYQGLLICGGWCGSPGTRQSHTDEDVLIKLSTKSFFHSYSSVGTVVLRFLNERCLSQSVAHLCKWMAVMPLCESFAARRPLTNLMAEETNQDLLGPEGLRIFDGTTSISNGVKR